LPFDPENPQVYEYLGKSATGLGDKELALRAMTSIAEVAPNRAALLARAGWLLMTAQKYEMAEQMFREALKNRKDDANIYRGLSLTLWLADKHDLAAKELSDAIKLDFDPRYGDVRRVLHEELGYLLRAWAQKDKDAALNFAQIHGVEQDMRRSDAFRATMCWETDANDVDLHVVDPNGEDCYYSNMHNASGLELYSDQTQGLGPEVIRADKMLTGTYAVGVTYFNAGPMGVSRGVVVIMKPEDGIVKQPQIIPFCLVPGAVGGADIRMVGREIKK
jgi:tetratricopeptide (TPR) repeat protein